MPYANSRRYCVDGNEYSVSISLAEIDNEDNMRLRVTTRAEYGYRSVCIIRGLITRSKWHDYIDIENFKSNSIAVTPRIVAWLIHWAHQQGWRPIDSKSNMELHATNEMIRSLDALKDDAQST